MWGSFWWSSASMWPFPLEKNTSLVNLFWAESYGTNLVRPKLDGWTLSNTSISCSTQGSVGPRATPVGPCCSIVFISLPSGLLCSFTLSMRHAQHSWLQNSFRWSDQLLIKLDFSVDQVWSCDHVASAGTHLSWSKLWISRNEQCSNIDIMYREAC